VRSLHDMLLCIRCINGFLLMPNKYSNLLKHTAAIRIKSAKATVNNTFSKKFDNLFHYLSKLEKMQDKSTKNLQLLLGCNLLNQLYSAIILFESGLYPEGLVHFRIALEVIAYKHCFNLGLIKKHYFDKKTHSFSEVIKILKPHHSELSAILLDFHSQWSEYCHLHTENKKHDVRFRLKNDRVLWGGEYSPNDLKHLLSLADVLIDLYINGLEGDYLFERKS
jgi:hypothetical protein